MYLFLCKNFQQKYALLEMRKAPIEKCCWLCKIKENLVKDLNGRFFCYNFKLHVDKGFPKFKLFDEMQNTFKIDLERTKL